jgi:hypothetical protein
LLALAHPTWQRIAMSDWLTDEEDAIAMMARIDARTSRRIHSKGKGKMLNGKLTRFVSGFSAFRWPDLAVVEAARLEKDGVRGAEAVARMLVHDWLPSYRQCAPVIRAVLVDSFRDALLALPVEDRRRISATVAHELGK